MAGTSSRAGELQWLDALPAKDSTTLCLCNNAADQFVTARTLVAEVFEEANRLSEAVQWAQVSEQPKNAQPQRLPAIPPAPC